MSRPSMILATASYDDTIRLWEPQSGQCYKTIFYPDLYVNKIEITPDKCKLAAACNPNIQLFDLNSYFARPERTFRTNSLKSNNVLAIGFQNDGNMMYSGSEDGNIKIWDLRVPKCQKELRVVSESRNKFGIASSSQKNVPSWQKEYRNCSAVNTLVLHPNQIDLISGDAEGIIRVWDLRTNSCRLELVPEIDTAIRSLSIMSDGTMMVAANNNGTCFVWKCVRERQTEFEPLQKIQAHDQRILKCLLSPQNKYLATASSDKTVKIWNVDGFKLERVLTGYQKWVWDCDFSGDGEFLLTASSDSTARLWSMQEGKELMVYKGHRKSSLSCVLSD